MFGGGDFQHSDRDRRATVSDDVPEDKADHPGDGEENLNDESSADPSTTVAEDKASNEAKRRWGKIRKSLGALKAMHALQDGLVKDGEAPALDADGNPILNGEGTEGESEGRPRDESNVTGEGENPAENVEVPDSARGVEASEGAEGEGDGEGVELNPAEDGDGGAEGEGEGGGGGTGEGDDLSGWEEAYTPEGQKYYVNIETQESSWTDPRVPKGEHEDEVEEEEEEVEEEPISTIPTPPPLPPDTFEPIKKAKKRKGSLLRMGSRRRSSYALPVAQGKGMGGRRRSSMVIPGKRLSTRPSAPSAAPGSLMDMLNKSKSVLKKAPELKKKEVDVRSTDMKTMLAAVKAKGMRKVEINAHHNDNAHVQQDEAVAKILANRQAIEDTDSESDSDDSGSEFTDSD